MAPEAVLDILWSHGITVALAEDDRLRVGPARDLRDEDCDLLRSHKAEVIQFLQSAHDLATELVRVAMQVCDGYGDGAEAREEMKRDCLSLPPHLQKDLLDHFQSWHSISQRQPTERHP